MLESDSISDPVFVGFMTYHEIEDVRRAQIPCWTFEETDRGAKVWVPTNAAA